MQSTPTYAIPYLTGADKMIDIPSASKQQADRLEALLKQRAVTPLNTDVQSISERLNRLEAAAMEVIPMSRVTMLNGYSAYAGSSLARIGDLVFCVMNASKQGLGVEDVFRVPQELAPPASVTTNAIASLGGGASQLTVVINTNGIVKNWSARPDNTLFSLTAFWKVGA